MSIDISQIREHFLAALGAGNLEKQIQFVEENFSARAEIRLQLLEMLQDHHNLTDQTDVTQGSPDTGTFASNGRPNVVFTFRLLNDMKLGRKLGRGDLETFTLRSKPSQLAGGSPLKLSNREWIPKKYLPDLKSSGKYLH